jgi:hypothetical protein
MWSEQKLQTLSTNIDRKYFGVRCVDTPMKSDDDQSMERILQRAKEEERELMDGDELIERDTGRSEESPWLTRTGWKDMFIGRNMKEMLRYIDLENDLEPEMSEVRKGVDRVVDRCMQSVRDLDARGWNEIRFWMRSHKVGVPHEKPFRRPSTELEKYKRIWTRLIFFCWRTFEIEDTGAQFLECQSDEIRKLRESVCLHSGDEKEVDDAIFKLSVSLIQHSDFENEKSAIKYFAGVMGYDGAQARWKRPSAYTPFLAGMQFCMRVLLLEDALPLGMRNGYRHGIDVPPLEQFQVQHSQWLVDGSATPYSWLHKLLNYGMTAAKEAKGEDRTRFSRDGKYCYFEGHGFKVEEWKTMVKDIIREMESVLSRELLFQNSDTIDPMNPYQFVDHEFVHDRGHYFAQLISDHRHRARETVLKNLKKSGRDWLKFIRGARDFDRCEVASYTKSVERFLELLLLAVNWTCGQTGRGTEMVSLLYKNKTSADRNIFVQDGQIMIVTSYHKSQAVTEDIKVRHKFLSDH